jgi:hypothetical protein
MTADLTPGGASDGSRSLRSVAAMLAGLVAIIVLSLGTDAVLHALNVYPPWGQPMHETSLNVLALSYRCVFAIIGGYVAASLAPRNPTRHALILGAIGVGLGVLGGIGATIANLGPVWYSVALVLTAVPSTWIGARLQQRRAA